jgi:hypothetical protein
MIKTLTRHGDKYALEIEKPLLEMLGIGPEASFEVVTDGHCLVLTPLRNAGEEKKFASALDMVHERFGRAMKRLAE